MAQPDRIEMLGAFLDQLWRGLEGFAAIPYSVPYLSDGGKYRHRPPVDFYFEWPSERGAILEHAAGAACYTADVLFCPILRSEPSRTRHTGAMARYAHVDVDRPYREVVSALDRVIAPGSLVVSSGNGAHLYAALDGAYDARTVEDVSQTLAAVLDADSKFPDNAMLRPPGSFNHKSTLQGQAPRLVTWQVYE